MANLFKIANYLKISFLSLRANKLRSFLSIIGVVFGVMAVIIIITIGEGAKEEALRQIERLGTKNIYIKPVTLDANKKKEQVQHHFSGLTGDDIDRIQTGCGYVNNIAALKEIPVSVIGTVKEISPQIAACSPSYFEILNLRLNDGRFFSTNDVAEHHQVCVVGYNVATQLRIDGAMGQHIRIGSHLFKIIGILKRMNIAASESSAVSERNYNEMIMLPMGSEKWIMPYSGPETAGSDLSELIIAVDDTEHVIESSEIIKKILEINHKGLEGYQIVAPLELLQQAKKTNELFNLLLFGIASVSLVVGGIGIMNIMLATVSERRREIGIRRAVGAKQKHILIQFLTEAALLTFTGGIIGIIAGVLTVLVMMRLSPWELIITAEAIILPLIIASLTGIFFGSYPAWKAAKLDPIKALTG